MKNKIICFTSALCLLISCLFLFSACGETKNNNCYVDAKSLPQHVQFVTECGTGGQGTDNNGKTYYLKESKLYFQVTLDEGYQIGTLKIFANDSQPTFCYKAWSSDHSKICYVYEYTIKSSVQITFSGNVEKLNTTYSFEVSEFYDSAHDNDVFLYFAKNSEYGLEKDTYTLGEIKHKQINLIGKTAIEFQVYSDTLALNDGNVYAEFSEQVNLNEKQFESVGSGSRYAYNFKFYTDSQLKIIIDLT